MSYKSLLPTEKKIILIESSMASIELFDTCIECLMETGASPEFFNEAFYQLRKYFKNGIGIMIKKINELTDQLLLLFDKMISNNRFLMIKNKDLLLELAKSPRAATSDKRLKMYDLSTFTKYPFRPMIPDYKMALDDSIIDSYLRKSDTLEFLFSNNLNNLIREMYGSLVPLTTDSIDNFNIDKFRDDILKATLHSSDVGITEGAIIECIQFMEDYSDNRGLVKRHRQQCVDAMYKLRESVEQSVTILDKEKLIVFSRKNLTTDPEIRSTKQYANLIKDLEDYYTIMANVIYQGYTIKFKSFKTILDAYKENIDILITETRLLYSTQESVLK